MRMDAIESLRKIFASKSHGQVANLQVEGIYLRYRTRYEKSARRVAALVRDAGGDVIELSKSGKMRSSDEHRVSQPWSVLFTVGVDEDTYLETGKRFGVMALAQRPKLLMGRLVSS